MKKTSKIGGYSVALTAVVLALVIVANLFCSSLPNNWTMKDISASHLFSISANTKAIVNNLTDDINIYWIAQNGTEESNIQQLLAQYESLSDHIHVTKIDPDVYPTFAAQYTDLTSTNNDIVVEGPARYRYIQKKAIFEYTLEYTSAGEQQYVFDGEGELTSAILYVTQGSVITVYQLTGHGETALSDTVVNEITRQNVDLKTLSLVSAGSIPKDAACLILYSPTSDLLESERDMIREYLYEGGKLMVMLGPVPDQEMKMTNSLLDGYGLSVTPGIVVETDPANYVFNAPYAIIPIIRESEITNPLIGSGYNVIFPLAESLDIPRTLDPTVDITKLLASSDTSINKVKGYGLGSYEYEEGDVEGFCHLAVAIRKEHDNGKTAQVVWFTSSSFLDDTYNAYSSGANLDLGMNALSWLVGETDKISIHSKSLNTEYLTMNETQAARIRMTLIGIIPAAVIVVGLIGVIVRRKKG